MTATVAVTVTVTGALIAGGLLLFDRYGPYVGFLEQSQPHPHGHDTVLVRVSSSPGMGTRELFFSAVPDLVVTGDGTAYAPATGDTGDTGDTGSLVRPVVTFHLDEGGIQGLLKRAAHDRLLAAHGSYGQPDVMDGGSTQVVVATSRGSWTHDAYALEGGGGFTARDRLADFVAAARQVASTTSARPVRPTALRVLATPLDPGQAGHDGAVATWPDATSVRLADVGDCAVVRDPAVIEALTTHDERTWRQGATTYSVAAAVLLPGDTCSA